MRWKKYISWLVLFVISINFNACSKKNNEVKESANEIVDIISDGNMEEINHIIFEVDEFVTEEEIEYMFFDEIGETKETKQDGILSEIFKRNSIKLKSVEETIVEYEIESPNLENLFIDILELNYELSEEEFLSYVKKYIDSAELKRVSVRVPYIRENGEIIMDYQCEDFINGITGGLLNAYQNFYEDMLEQYIKELEE